MQGVISVTNCLTWVDQVECFLDDTNQVGVCERDPFMFYTQGKLKVKDGHFTMKDHPLTFKARFKWENKWEMIVEGVLDEATGGFPSLAGTYSDYCSWLQVWHSFRH